MKQITFNFVINATEAELRTYIKAKNIDAALVAARGDLSWCFEAFRALSKTKNLHSTLSNCLRSNAINIVHAAQLLQLKGNARQFIVCVQGDAPFRHWAHYHLVQNKTQLTANSEFMPHWVQPNIVPRNVDRTTVAHVAYTGPTNTNGALSETQWQSFLNPYDICFTNFTGPWNDLSTVDVLIGIRSFDSNTHDTKPASRLFSAWHAGVAFIGGPDSAYRQVGTPGKNYLVVHSPEEALKAVLRLRSDSGLYKMLIENGKKKALQYNNERITQHWEAVLTGPVLKRYMHWKGRPHYEQIRFNTLLKLAFL